MEVIYSISAFLSLAVLICFFTMGYNIGAIKRSMDAGNPNKAMDEFHKALFWGDNEQATVQLKEAFWHDFKQIIHKSPTNHERMANYSKLKAKYL